MSDRLLVVWTRVRPIPVRHGFGVPAVLGTSAPTSDFCHVQCRHAKIGDTRNWMCSKPCVLAAKVDALDCRAAGESSMFRRSTVHRHRTAGAHLAVPRGRTVIEKATRFSAAFCLHEVRGRAIFLAHTAFHASTDKTHADLFFASICVVCLSRGELLSRRPSLGPISSSSS